MKFLKFTGGRFHFRLETAERDMLLQIIERYPLIPAAYHRASLGESAKGIEATQKLLEEALEGQRQETRRQIKAVMDAGDRLQRKGRGWVLSLGREEIQWLLQVLNDVRVGSWLILGQPDELHEQPLKLPEDKLPFLWAMEVCGYFQMTLLRALESGAEA